MKSRLISTKSLFEKLKTPNKNLKIFDCTFPNSVGISSYMKEKISGADFLFLQSLSDPKSKYSNTFPPNQVFKYLTDKLNITPENEIVFYDSIGAIYSPRAFFIFKSYNFKNIYILDGGLPKWQNENLKTESNNKVDQNIMQDYKDNEKDVKLNYDKNSIIDYDEIKKLSESINKEDPVIIDTRPLKNFNGGNIPKSKHLFYMDYFQNDKTFLPKEELIEKFKAINVNALEQQIVSTCGIAISAAITNFVISEIIGNDKIKIYDGSYEEYSDKNKK